MTEQEEAELIISCRITLTSRENEVEWLIRAKYSPEMISKVLLISVATIEKHIRNIQNKKRLAKMWGREIITLADITKLNIYSNEESKSL